MCGRAYHTYTDDELAFRYLNEHKIVIPDLPANYNLAPTRLTPIVRVVGDERKLDQFRWGLIPGWAKDVKSAAKYSLINARGEEIASKRSYAEPFRLRRCIVPLSGFFEWKREGTVKRPFAIHLKGDAIMSVAGVWEEWTSRESGEIIHSFAVITTRANEFMSAIHDRMPVILGRGDEEAWLDPESQDPTQLEKLLKPCPDEWLSTFEVSTLVNSPRNVSKEVLVPVSG